MVPMGVYLEINPAWLNCRVEGETQNETKGCRTLDSALRDLAFILKAAFGGFF